LNDSDVDAYSIAFACKNENWEHVQKTVDSHMKNILRETGADDYQCYLTGKQCFRREKYPDYKGQRKQEKPKWHSAIRQYLIEEHNAIVTDDGREADDWIAEICRDDWNKKYVTSKGVKTALVRSALKYVPCSSDKDFNTFPGWHYNPKWKVKYWVSEEDADLWFWCQMIQGDTADNIKGIPGKGKMAAYKILSKAEDPKLAVIAAYRNHYGEDFKEMYDKNYELLHIGKRIGARL